MKAKVLLAGGFLVWDLSMWPIHWGNTISNIRWYFVLFGQGLKASKLYLYNGLLLMIRYRSHFCILDTWYILSLVLQSSAEIRHIFSDSLWAVMSRGWNIQICIRFTSKILTKQCIVALFQLDAGAGCAPLIPLQTSLWQLHCITDFADWDIWAQ